MTDFGLYLVITNPVVGYAACAEAAVRAGVGIIQLRMKHATRGEIVREAVEMRRVTAGTGTLFIVNDDPSIAEEVGADGVHVGQGDMPPVEVRRRFPGLRIVGLSTHSMEQVEASWGEPVDYIGVGMIAAASVPAVAIGGINAETLPPVLAAGAKNFAVVRAVCGSRDPESTIRELLSTFQTS